MDQQELISISEAAKRLGLHRNTINKRIKAGRYTAEWAPGPHGPQHFVHVSTLNSGVDTPQTTEPSASSLTYHAPPAAADLPALLNQTLHPVLEQIRQTERDNGRLTAENALLRDENARLSDELAKQRESPPAPIAEAPRSFWRVLFGRNA